MQTITCVNCGLDYVIPSGDRGSCPRCATENVADGMAAGEPPVSEFDGGVGGGFDLPGLEAATIGGGVEEAAGAGGSDIQVFCFNCGKAMMAAPDEVLPVCRDCKGDASAAPPPLGPPPASAEPPPAGAYDSMSASAASPAPGPAADPQAPAPGGGTGLMIRKASGDVFGPFDLPRLEEWVRAGKILPHEEVAEPGGDWVKFSHDPRFSGLFPSGPTFDGPPPALASGELEFKKKNPMRDFMRRSGPAVGIGAAVVVLAGGLFWLMSSGIVQVPESVATKLGIGEPEEPPLFPERDETFQAEYRGVVDAVGEPPEGTAREWFLRARKLLLTGKKRDIIAAKGMLEKAVVLDPYDSLALAALGEVYVQVSILDSEFVQIATSATYFIEEAIRSEDYVLEGHRAKARSQLGTNSHADALASVSRAARAGEDAELEMLRGRVFLMRDGKLTSNAQEAFLRAVELNPLLHSAYTELGQAALADGDDVAALDFFTRKLQADPSEPDVHMQLGALREGHGEFERALEAYNDALTLDPGHKEANLRAGRLLSAVFDRAEEAIQPLSLLLAARDENGEEMLDQGETVTVRNALADALRISANCDEAIGHAREVLAVDANDVNAHANLAMCAFMAEDWERSSRSFSDIDQSALDEREQSMVQTYRGVVARKQLALARASELFRSALALWPANMPAHIEFMANLAESNQTKQAKAHFQEMMVIDPMYYRRPSRPASLYLPPPDLSDARDAIHRAGSKQSYDPDWFAMAAAASYHAGMLDDTERVARLALDERPGHAPSYFYMGLVSLEKEDFEAAAERFKRAIVGEHDIATFHTYEAIALGELGEDSRAIESLRKSLQYNQRDPWTHLVHARLLRGQQRFSDARASYESAQELDPRLGEPRKALFEMRQELARATDVGGADEDAGGEVDEPAEGATPGAAEPETGDDPGAEPPARGDDQAEPQDDGDEGGNDAPEAGSESGEDP
jgi:tetratricopeptide (TPR) repeat protein